MIERTVADIPLLVDLIIVVNDASTDSTAAVALELAAADARIRLVNLEVNQGVGGAVIAGIQYALSESEAQYVGLVAGDAQFDSSYLTPMLAELDAREADYVKASRFYHREAFQAMPKYRQFGNMFISLLTKFSTGFYSVTDITNGCGFLTREILQKVDFSIVRRRYDFETSMLTALSIADAKVIDHAVPAHYGDEKSTIKLLPTAVRNISAVWTGFWRRIFRKYVLFGFHPIALFLYGGVLLFIIGLIAGIAVTVDRIVSGNPASSGTIMLIALPLIMGFQLLLTALSMDVSNERK